MAGPDSPGTARFTIRQRNSDKVLLGTDYIDVCRVAALALGPRFAPLEVYADDGLLLATVEERQTTTTALSWERVA